MSIRVKGEFFSGQTLIEVVVSIGIAVLLAISLITTSLITQKSSRSARNNSQATKLVQQTLEQLRIFRDRHPPDDPIVDDALEFLPNAPTATCYSLDATSNIPDNWTLNSASCSTTQTITLDNTNFNRKIEMINQGLNAEKRLITITISWDESGQTRSVKSQTFLGLWQDFP